MQIISVLIAAAACWGIGAIYYSLLSNQWLSAIGKSKEEIQGGDMKPYIITLIAQIICVGMMRYMFNVSGISGGAATLAGAGIGAFIVGAWIFVNNAFEGKPIKLSVINTGYAVLGLAAAGAILGFF